MFTHTGCFCHVPRNGTQAVPYGFAGGRFRSTVQVIFAAWHGDESSPLHWVYRVLGNTIQPHWLYLQRGGRQIAAPTCVVPLRPLFLQSRTPYRASSTAYGGPPSPKGKVLRGSVQPHSLYSSRCLAMNHRRYIGCTVYWAIPFNRTGYIRNVAGGRLPPLHAQYHSTARYIFARPRNGTQAVPYGFAER